MFLPFCLIFIYMRILCQKESGKMKYFSDCDNRIMTKKLGLALRERRIKKGYSLMQLAAKANIDCSYLSRIENGKNAVTVVKLADLLHILNIRMSDFFLELE